MRNETDLDSETGSGLSISLHRLLNPGGPFLSNLHKLFVGHLVQLEINMRLWHVTALLEPRTRQELVHPLLDVGELVDLTQATVFWSDNPSAD